MKVMWKCLIFIHTCVGSPINDVERLTFKNMIFFLFVSHSYLFRAFVYRVVFNVACVSL